MSRGDQNLDELFKNAFQPQVHEVVPAYWQEAQQMINASKVAKTPFYLKPFFIAGALLVTASISAGLFFGSTPEKQISENLTNPVLIATPSKNPSKIVSENLKSNSYPNQNSQTNAASNNSTEIQIANSTVSAKKTTSQIATGSSTSKKVNAATNAQNPSFQEKWKSVSFKTKLTTQKGSDSHAQNTEKTVSKNITASAVSNPENRKVATSNTTTGLAKNHFEFKNNTEQILRLNAKPWGSLETASESEISQNLKESKHKKLYNPFSVRLSAGALWEGESSTTNSMVTSKAQEQNMELTVEYQFHKRWGVQSGISWSQQQHSQSFSYLEEVNNSYWTTDENVSTVINRVWWLGDWYYYPTTYDTTYEDVYVFLKDSVNQNTQLKSKLTLIEVPILLTYNYAWNRVNIQLASGISLGTVINASGSYFSSNDPFAQEIKSQKDFAPLQTSFLFHSEFGYGLNSNWWLTARPQLKWNLNSIAPQNATISPKVFYYGVNAGLMYRF